jgi:replicative DNA helicase
MTPAERGKEANREQQVAGLTRALKATAKELKVPVIALAQLNRATETGRDKEPTLANLRESGAVEQDADTVLFIHRQDAQTVAVEGDVRLIIAKNRTGPTGGVDLRWIPSQTRFASQGGS